MSGYPTRRRILQSAATLTVGALAGCSDDMLSGTDEDTSGIGSGYAALFPLWDWAGQVSGELASFEYPVSMGQLGHGWEPDTDLIRDIASSDAFVYFDSREFLWAQDLARTLESDYEDVVVIDAMAGLDQYLLKAGETDHADEEDNIEEDHNDTAAEFADPHVWLDPLLARKIVETIADGLGGADPDRADRYADNAEAYLERIDTVHDQFETLVENAERDVAVLAGHDSFRYLEARYDFTLHSPQGVSPDASPSSSDIADTIELVDSEGIDTILYDVFEAGADVPPLAQSILGDSNATDAAPLTPVAGTTDEWQADDWGWVEQMTEINLESLGRALGATATET